MNNLLNGQNPIASGGILLMLAGGLMAVLRKVPDQLWRTVRLHTTVACTITDQSRAFKWVQYWFETHRIEKLRAIDITTPWGRKDFLVSPAPGTHWFMYRNALMRFSFSRTENGNGYDTKRAEVFTLQAFGRSAQPLRAFIQEAHQVFKSRQDQDYLHVWGENSWTSVSSFHPRTLESVIVSETTRRDILDAVQWFLKNPTWYRRHGIPYHFGCLLYGPPGTGKTSLVSGLASHFNRSIYTLPLAQMTDASLLKAVAEAGPHSIILLEDIDCASVTHERTTKSKDKEKLSGVTLSGLLNVLDGVQTPEGALFCMTTNHLERLDTALIRPGRADLLIKLDHATLEQKQELFARLQPDVAFPDALAPINVPLSKVQEYALQSLRHCAIN